MWAKQVKAEKQAREIIDDTTSDDGHPSASASDSDGDLIDLSSSTVVNTTVGVDQTMGPIPRSQEEAVGIAAVQNVVRRTDTVTPPSAGAEGSLQAEGSESLSKRPQLPDRELRRSASGTSLRQAREVRWDTTGLKEALGRK